MPNSVLTPLDTRCVRVGCGGVVKAVNTVELGTIYQCQKCKGCGNGSRITPPPPSETKLKTALDVFSRVCQNIGAVFAEKGIQPPELTKEERGLSINAARSSLESLYRDIEAERDEARDCAREYENERNNLSKDYATLLSESNGFEAELSALRSLQLTKEEAKAQIEGVHHLPDPRYHTWLMGRNKLRAQAGMGPQPHEVPPHIPGISSKATSEEL